MRWGRIAYMLANGQGKQRAGRTGQARTIRRWRLMTLSTGERSLSAVMAEIGRKPSAGQLVRLLTIPANFEHGVFSDLHGFSDGRALADHLKQVRTRHYGHLGPAFLERAGCGWSGLSRPDVVTCGCDEPRGRNES